MGATSATTDRPALTPADCAAALAALRERPPLVQSLTNIVVAQWTANVLLAVGAAPAMVDNPREAAAFARVAGGVLVNLGTPYDDTALAMEQAVAAAADHGTPWVLDPVAAGALQWRTTLALRPARARPAGRHPRQRLGGPGPDRRRRRQGRRLRGHPGGRPGRRPRPGPAAPDRRRGERPRRPPHRRGAGGAGPQRAPVAHPGHRRRLRARRAGGRLRRRRPGPAARGHRRDDRPSPSPPRRPRRPAAAPGPSPSRCWTSSPPCPPRGWPTPPG